jgi:hypothetical protein
VPEDRSLGFAVDLSPPPTNADEQKSPVLKKLRRLSFEGMADELENPSQDKQSEPVRPQTVDEDAGQQERQRKHNGRNAQGVASPIYGMLVAGGVLCDPLIAGSGSMAWHSEEMIQPIRSVPRCIFGSVLLVLIGCGVLIFFVLVFLQEMEEAVFFRVRGFCGVSRLLRIRNGALVILVLF